MSDLSAPEFPRPFGVPPLPNSPVGSLGNPELQCPKCGHGFGVGGAALAGPESAAEHLRNALQVIDGQLNHWSGIARQAGVRPEAMVSWFEDIAAVRRRVAAALALLEAKP